MQLQDYARIVWKRGWIVVLLSMAAALSAVVFSKLQTPIYHSTIAVKAVPSRPADMGQGQAIKNMLRQYVQDMQSPLLIQPVIDQLQLDVTPARFISQINFAPSEEALIITMDARHPFPAVAQRMVQRLAEAFVTQHEQDNLGIDQRDRILVRLQYNATPPELFSPIIRVNAIAGTVLGGLIGLLVVFVPEWLESGVLRTVEDVERYLGIAVLSSIPRMSEVKHAPQPIGMRFSWLWTRRTRTICCPHCGNFVKLN